MTRNGKVRITLMLAILSNGSKHPSYIILKQWQKTIIASCHCKMNEEKWLDKT